MIKSISRISISILFLTFFTTTSIAQKPDSYLGEWVGTYTFNSGTKFQMGLTIDKADKKAFEGTVIWPEYFNSGSYISGSMKKSQLKFNEIGIMQGIEMDISADYSMELIDSRLEGQVYNTSGDQFASFILYKLSDLDEKEANNWETLKSNQLEKFGEAIILEEKSTMEGQQIYDRVMQSNQMPTIESMIIKGTFNMKGFEMPAKITTKKKKQFIELSFQGSKFINGRNDSIEWSYNPLEDAVTVKVLDNDNDAKNESFLENDLTGDMKVKKCHTVNINGKSGYRLVLNYDTILVAFVVDDQIVRIEKKEDIMDMGQYQIIDEIEFPMYIKKVSFTEEVTIKIDHAELNPEVSDSLFEMSEEMIAKISYTENHSELNETGNQYFEQGDYEQAIGYYNQAIAQTQMNYVYFFNRGFAYLNLGKYYEAITDLSRSIEINDQYPKSWNKRGEAKSKLGDYKNALNDYQQAYKLDSTFEEAQLNIGVAHYLTENYDSAANTFQKLMLLNPQKGLYHYNHAYSLHQMGEDSLAAISFSNAIKNGYNGAEAYNMLGIAQYRTNQYHDAIENFSKAIGLNGEIPMYTLNLGKSYYYDGQFDSAKVYISNFLEINPKNDDALNIYGLCYFKENDFQTAISYFTKAIEVSPGNAVFFDNRAYAKSGMMNYTGAIDDFTESITLYSKDSEIFYQRGLMNLNINNRFDACKDFVKARDLGNDKAESAIKENCEFIRPADGQ